MSRPPVANDAPRGDRIAKLLARAGVASRREVERMIADGRVALDGTMLDTPATILPSLRGITVDGNPVAAAEAARLFVFHKPPGLLVTERDPAGRPTIYDRLPRDLPRTVPVGRLDLATEGLLLLTTDGGLKRQLELPATGVERTYRARAYGDVTQAMLEGLIEGVEIEGVRYGPIDANLERRTGANAWIELTLTEGKNREVRRVLEFLGLQVGRLIRTRYGPFVLGDLPPGQVGEVKQHDLVAFARTLGGPRRGKGADLDAPVAVEPRAPGPARPAEAVPAPASPPARPTRPSARAAAAKPAGGGWGSRVRPSRPAEPAEPQRRPARTGTRTDDDRPRRDRPAPAVEHRAQGDARATTSSRAPSTPRPDERPRRTPPGRPGEQRRDHSERPAAAPRPARGPNDRPDGSAGRTNDRAPARPGKGPAGGRGHPPRGGKAPPRGAPKGKR